MFVSVISAEMEARETFKGGVCLGVVFGTALGAAMAMLIVAMWHAIL
jgi:hypothetical protein